MRAHPRFFSQESCTAGQQQRQSLLHINHISPHYQVEAPKLLQQRSLMACVAPLHAAQPQPLNDRQAAQSDRTCCTIARHQCWLITDLFRRLV